MSERMEAMLRMLLDSGDITMQGARWIEKLMDEELPDE